MKTTKTILFKENNVLYKIKPITFFMGDKEWRMQAINILCKFSKIKVDFDLPMNDINQVSCYFPNHRFKNYC